VEGARLGLEAYGPDILGYLIAVARSEADGAEAFSAFCEDLWKGLPEFRGACSFRTWAYTLARHALFRLKRADGARRRRELALSDAPEILRIAEHVRTTTQVHLRTEVKTRVAQLRESLDPDDQTLLILRIDRRLPWREVAQIMSGRTDLDDAGLRTEAAKLRKRYERAKERLRALVERDEEFASSG
jgi:RNA polymerase sigma-70 factor (ECF subfamily)